MKSVKYTLKSHIGRVYEISMRREIAKIFGESYAKKCELNNLNDIINIIITEPLKSDKKLEYVSDEYRKLVHAKRLAKHIRVSDLNELLIKIV